MISTAHIAVGAGIGGSRLRAGAAVALAVVSHFVLDHIPHLDWNQLYRTGVISYPTRMSLAVADMLLGFALIAVLAWRHPRRWIVLAAAACAIAPDAIFNAGPWSVRICQIPWLTPIADFHHAVQNNVQPGHWVLGAATQLAVVVVSLALVRITVRGK